MSHIPLSYISLSITDGKKIAFEDSNLLQYVSTFARAAKVFWKRSFCFYSSQSQSQNQGGANCPFEPPVPTALFFPCVSDFVPHFCVKVLVWCSVTTKITHCQKWKKTIISHFEIKPKPIYNHHLSMNTLPTNGLSTLSICTWVFEFRNLIFELDFFEVDFCRLHRQ